MHTEDPISIFPNDEPHLENKLCAAEMKPDREKPKQSPPQDHASSSDGICLE